MFEEVKEMIDSTVYTNGNGEVTAQNINLAMQGIVEAAEEKIEAVETNVADVTNRVAELEQNGGSGNAGGSGPLRVWINEANTTEQIAENISTYNAIKDKHHENIVLCYEESNGEWEASATMPVSVEYEAVNDDGVAFLETIIASDPVNSSKTHVMLVRLYNDGTTEISFQYEQSNGQLVIYSGTINADGTATLSDEEKSANMSIYNALMSGQVMPIVYKQDLTQVMGYARIWSNVVADVYPEYGVQIKASYAASLGALESQNFVLNPDGTLDFDAI